jgi:LytS/YehU family sensor histidine kinase
MGMGKTSRYWIFFVLLPFALLWQTSAWSVLPVFGWRVDPTLVLVMASGLLLGPRYGLFFGLVAGGSQDLLLGAGLLYSATKALAGFAAGFVKPHLYRFDIVSLGLIGFVWTLIEGLIVALDLMLSGRGAVWDHYAALALPLGLAHAALLILCYAWLARLPDPSARE